MNSKLMQAMALMVIAIISIGVISLDSDTDAVDGDTTVASIDSTGKQYTSLSDAFTDAKDGDTITLLSDSLNTTNLTIDDGRSLTVNLNGYDISFGFKNYFLLKLGDLSITGNGTVYESQPYYGAVMINLDQNASKDVENIRLTVGEDVTLRGWGPIFINANFNGTGKPSTAYGVVVDVYGTLDSIEDTAGANGHAIYVNGQITVTDGLAPVINIYDTANIDSLGNGMYIAGYAKVNIYGGSIDAPTGIEIRAGELNVYGGTITSTSDTFSSDPNGNGSTTVGVGIAVSQHTTDLPISANVSGGQISGMYALYQTSKEEGNNPSIVNIDISGGTFTCTTDEEGYYAVYSANKTSFVTGGTFNGGVDESLIAPGVDFAVNPDGSIGVGDDIVKDEPSNPSYDDDELPPFIPTQPKDSGDDVTIVACAAAAVVAALMAVFLIVSYKKE